ncbi:GNAT family N-acetyltransferase [Tenuibacillus multivorans]|uniref:Ribosomal protein S18 acetylase RimI n=1 Tax=Tenuibacillus multivorans TaxID=237069 RepID=A0A1H0DDJ1_9BACI|nr:GNAT family N-acetyltransferase [Tenuibacillus multivorans]GEL76603.1 hypothetical protein TMU01_08380 [Tenuibacillus multivorans]SDN68059.1 Ribosomal protein S18 acetylase RimI [Tenuibacillus multivorans]
MTIRKATYNETQEILKHALDVLEEATMGYVEPRREKALEMVSPFLSNGGYYLVCIENNVIQGWVGIGRTFDYHTDQVIGIIPEIYVLPKFRKKGLAEKLCKKAFKQLKEEGHEKVQLNVYAGNPVKHLYEKLGFQKISTLMERDLNDEP